MSFSHWTFPFSSRQVPTSVCVCVVIWLKKKQTNLFQIFVFENLVPYRHKKNSPDQEQSQKSVFWDDWQVCLPGKVSVLWLGVKSYGLGPNPQLCRSETKSLKIFKVGKPQRDWITLQQLCITWKFIAKYQHYWQM